MEFFKTKEDFIISNGNSCLWCSRSTGLLSVKKASSLDYVKDKHCLGKVYGVIGKIQIHPEMDWKLLVIRQQSKIASLAIYEDVYKIDRVTAISLSDADTRQIDLEPCATHVSKSVVNSKKPSQAWNSIKSAAENVKPKVFKMVEEASMLQLQKELKEKEKYERRLLEEVLRMFNEMGCFYYCPHGDLTSNIRRQHLLSYDKKEPIWRRADSRFFWNYHLLGDLINSQDPLADDWIVPVIQGYVHMEVCKLALSNNQPLPEMEDVCYTIYLVSRRSRFRAGMRYKRRGVDEAGHCANYVETEQILEFINHVASFVEIRGSVPLYWSQSGIQYKPPPKIERDDEENARAFRCHMESECGHYQQVACISLLDQVGKEKVVADKFLHHVLQFNSPKLSYVTFDFHEYCRGMNFDNVSILTENIIDLIKTIRYCWVDDSGLICEQQGVFRINCLDCLDRTNVVQSAIGRIVLEVQCRKLGLLSPEQQLPVTVQLAFQRMWANNGDIISQQYTGTAALKGDYTRTGERKITGMMKDGVNSASRYYLGQVKDEQRQAVLDLLQGTPPADVLVMLRSDHTDAAREDERVLVEKEENMKLLISESMRLIIKVPEECLGGWGLVNLESEQTDMDSILLLTQSAYYVCRYDDDKDQIVSYQRIPLEFLDKIVIGPVSSLLKSSVTCIRFYYIINRAMKDVYFHTFHLTGTRLFNNIAIKIKNDDEAKEVLLGISESFRVARNLNEMDILVCESKLDRKKSPPHTHDVVTMASAVEAASVNFKPSPAALLSESSENLIVPHIKSQVPAMSIKYVHSKQNDDSKVLIINTITDQTPTKMLIPNNLSTSKNTFSEDDFLVKIDDKGADIIIESCGIITLSPYNWAQLRKLASLLNDQVANQQDDQLINLQDGQLVSQPISQPVGQLGSGLASQPDGQSIGQLASKLNGELVSEPHNDTADVLGNCNCDIRLADSNYVDAMIASTGDVFAIEPIAQPKESIKRRATESDVQPMHYTQKDSTIQKYYTNKPCVKSKCLRISMSQNFFKPIPNVSVNATRSMSDLSSVPPVSVVLSSPPSDSEKNSLQLDNHDGESNVSSLNIKVSHSESSLAAAVYNGNFSESLFTIAAAAPANSARKTFAFGSRTAQLARRQQLADLARRNKESSLETYKNYQTIIILL